MLRDQHRAVFEQRSQRRAITQDEGVLEQRVELLRCLRAAAHHRLRSVAAHRAQRAATCLQLWYNTLQYTRLRSTRQPWRRLPRRPHVHFEKPLESLGCIDRVEIEINDDIPVVIDGLIDAVGADAFADAILLIDYERSRIAITTTPPSAAAFSFIPSRVEQGRLMLPLEVDGRREEFLFDTGASLFSIITPRAAWTRLAQERDGVETIPGVTSWGVDYTVSTAAPRAELQLGGRALHAERVYAHPAPVFVLFPIRYGVTGLVGNELFRHDIVALDFQQDRFGLGRD
jgi:hypothetical protein